MGTRRPSRTANLRRTSSCGRFSRRTRIATMPTTEEANTALRMTLRHAEFDNHIVDREYARHQSVADLRQLEPDRGEERARFLVSTSASGSLEIFFSACSSRNAGVSASCRRMYSPIAARRMLIRNGTRRAHARNSGCGARPRSANMPVAARALFGSAHDIPSSFLAPALTPRPAGGSEGLSQKTVNFAKSEARHGIVGRWPGVPGH